MIDQIQNFIKGSVNGTHNAAVTTVNVNDADDYPDPTNGEYNLTWYDATNYPDPIDDPNKEIVRVTGRDTGIDTLTVTRNQEGSGASTKSTGGATYKLILTPTKKSIEDILKVLNPIGTIREFNVSTNPATLLGFGTWVAHGTGRVTVAIDAGEADFDTVDETSGEKDHTLSDAEMPSHGHGLATRSVYPATGGAQAFDPNGADQANFIRGSDSAHNNVQPSIVVYRWVRTA